MILCPTCRSANTRSHWKRARCLPDQARMLIRWLMCYCNEPGCGACWVEHKEKMGRLVY